MDRSLMFKPPPVQDFGFQADTEPDPRDEEFGFQPDPPPDPVPQDEIAFTPDIDFLPDQERGALSRNVTGPVVEFGKAVPRGAANFGTSVGPGSFWQAAEAEVGAVDARISEIENQLAVGEAQVEAGRRPNVEAPRPTARGFFADMGRELIAFAKTAMTGKYEDPANTQIDRQRASMQEFRQQNTRPEDRERLEALRTELTSLKEGRPDAVAKAESWKQTMDRWNDAVNTGILKPRENMSAAESYLSDIGEGLGQFGLQMGLRYVTGGASQALLAGQVQGVNEYLQARESGLAIDEAKRVYALNTILTAATEWMPIEMMMKGVDGSIVARFLKQGTAEGLQEVADQMKSNLIAQYSYDPTRGILDNAGRSFAVAFGVGGIAGAISRDASVARPDQTQAAWNADAAARLTQGLREQYGIQDVEVLAAVERRMAEAGTPEEVSALYADIDALIAAESGTEPSPVAETLVEPPAPQPAAESPVQPQAPEGVAEAVAPGPAPEAEVIDGEAVNDTPELAPSGDPLPGQEPIVDQRPGRAPRGNEGFRVRYRATGATPLIDFVAEQGGIMARGKGYRGGEYDDAPSLQEMGGFAAVLYGGRTERPDQIAQYAYNAGVLDDPTASALWTKLRDEMSSYRKQREDANRQDSNQKAWIEEQTREARDQGRNFKQDLLKERKRRERIPVDDLKVGDQVQVGRTKLTITEVDADTGDVILEDGKKYGAQIVSEGQILYVDRAKLQPIETVLEDAETFFGQFNPQETRDAPAQEEVPPQTQPEVAGPVRAVNPATGQTELIGQEEGGFRLVGEEGVDQARIQREQQQAEDAAAEADRRQGRLFANDFPAKRREVAEALGPKYAKEFDRRVKQNGSAEAVAWADTQLAPTRDLGDGVTANRDEGGGWTLTLPESPAPVRLDPAQPDHAVVLKDLDPVGNREAVQSQVDELTKGWDGSVKVEVLDSPDQLPDSDRAEVRRKIGDGGAQGVFISNGRGRPRVVVFAGQTTPAEAVRVALHEAVGHAGLRGVMGKQFDGFLDGVFEGQPRRQFEQIAKKYGLDLNTVEGRREAAEEWLARLAEERTNFPGMWSRVVSGFRQWLRSIGITIRVTENDIAGMLYRARQYAEGRRTGSAQPTNDATRLSIVTPDIRFSKLTPEEAAAQQKAALVAARKKVLQGEKKKLSGFTARMVHDEKLTVEQARHALMHPKSERVPQNLTDLKESLSGMTQATLDKLITFSPNLDGPVETREQVVAGLALSEKLNRALAAGENPVEILGEGAKIGRIAGQVLRQMREIKSSSAGGMASIVESLVVNDGRQLTDPQRTKLTELAQVSLDRQRDLDAAMRLHQEHFTDATAEALLYAENQAYAADTSFQRYAARLLPVKIGDQISAMIRGNLLAIKSHVVNFFGNTEYGMLRTGAQAVGSFTDRLDTFIHNTARRATGRPADVQRSLLGPHIGTRAALRGFREGGREARRILKDGSAMVAGERVKTLHPKTAFFQAVFGEDMAVDARTGKVRLADRAAKFLEGTLGWAPEINLRLLALADAPMRVARTRQVLYEIGKARGLKGKALERFVQFPDSSPINLMSKGKGRPDQRDAATYISEKAGREAVFQQENILVVLYEGGLRAVEQFNPAFGRKLRTIATTFVPYVKTPSNLMIMGVQYIMPELGVTNAVVQYARGNRREAHLAFGRAAIGYMMLGAAQWLIEKGALVGDEENERVRNLGRGLGYIGALNVSQLARARQGKPAGPWQPGDRILDLRQLGFAGLTLMSHANSQAQAVQAALDADTVADPGAVWNPAMRLGSAVNALRELPMLRGTADFLQVIENWSEATFNNWFRQYSEVLTSVALPNTAAAFARMKWDYIPERRGDALLDSFANVVKARIGLSDQLPLKRDLFGRPIRQNPEGATPWVYQHLDLSRSKDFPSDPLYNELYRLYRSTMDYEAIPSLPQKQVKNPVTRKVETLTQKDYERYLVTIGRAREVLMRHAMAQPAWGRMTDPQKVTQLKRLWDQGREKGAEGFWVAKLRPENLGMLQPGIQAIVRDLP